METWEVKGYKAVLSLGIPCIVFHSLSQSGTSYLYHGAGVARCIVTLATDPRHTGDGSTSLLALSLGYPGLRNSTQVKVKYRTGRVSLRNTYSGSRISS